MSPYNSLVKDHFFNPRNNETLVIDDQKAVCITVGEKALGDYIRAVLVCNAEEEILYFRYKVLGNPYLIAGISYCSDALIGKRLSEAMMFSHLHVVRELAIPKNRLYCALMVEDTVKDLISTWWKTYGREDNDRNG